MRVTLSVVSFLNTRPLIYGIENGLVPHRFTVTYDVPSRCALRVHNGEADAGLIPSIEYARSRTPYAIVPGVSIASHGPVRSIFLFHSVPVERIRSVAMDTSSRTSVALTQIILHYQYGITCSCLEHRPRLEEMLKSADAALIIGDVALEYADSDTPHIDLGAAWTELTGLPFVYAFWAGRPEALEPGDTAALIRSADVGLQHIPEIASAYAAERNRPAAPYVSYLANHLKFSFGPQEQAGLEEFYRRSHRLGLIANAPSLQFYET